MNSYELAKSIAALFLQQRLQNDQGLTRESIGEAVNLACDGNKLSLSIEERESLTRELHSEYQTVIGRETEMRGDDTNWGDWLKKRSAEIDWNYWQRYKTFLGQGSFSDKVLDRLDTSTDRVLNLVGNPERKTAWDRRGLVVGLVQSGKTAHYVGLMNKAVDSGYKIIVVLTGFNENLRVQTQIRVEEGLLGYSLNPDPDNPANRITRTLGVGAIPTKVKLMVDTVTTRKTDFRKAIADALAIHPGGNPILFVIKKNATALRHVLNWVVDFASRQDSKGQKYVPAIPLLVIDDESDVGSVDTRKGAIDSLGEVDPEHDPTTINKQIRKLLSLFDQSSYVGYTATPFANVLIHDMVNTGADKDGLLIGEDLFPRSFIVSLPSPDNHIGPTVMFGSRSDENTGLPIIRTISDISEKPPSWMPEKHKKDHEPLVEQRDEIPKSLRRAILSFILVIAARNQRNDREKHNSMLIHVTRFVDVQGRVYDQVQRLLINIRDRLRNNLATDQLMNDFRELWCSGAKDENGHIIDEGFSGTSRKLKAIRGDRYDGEFHDWEKIRGELRVSVESIEVRRIHGESGEDLDYQNHPTGLNVIAIGGDKLSRGLTLEGLSVSYFLRSSRMYDTLMQMGRWFGYRPRYLDLCRLYTTEKLCRWFGQIADATEELRTEFDKMAAMKCTPKEFGLRVRSHPEMLVTSAVKMRHGTTMQVTFQGSIVETIDFSRKREDIIRNWMAGDTLIQNMEDTNRVPSTQSPANYEWADIEPKLVIDFLRGYKQHESAKKVIPKLLREYIKAENGKKRLIKWRVLVATGVETEEGKPEFKLGECKGACVRRAWNDNEDGTYREELIKDNHYRIRRLVSPNHETAGMIRGTLNYETALKRTIAKWEERKERGEKVGDQPEVPGGPFIREVRDPKEGVLMLYPLSADEGKAEDKDSKPILGFGISFPSVRELSATKVTYQVNNVYQKQEELF